MKLQGSAIEQARAGMHGRILRCPLGNNPKDCPLHDVRILPLEERIMWLDSKTDEEMVKLFILHTHCLERKSAKRSAALD